MSGLLRSFRLSPLLAAVGILLVALPAPPAVGGELKPFVRGSFGAILEAYADRPLVVSFWSIACAPCLSEFQVWRELQAAYPGFSLVLVSTDRASQEPRVRAALDERGMAGLENWIFAESFADRLRFDVDRRWRGELPRNYLVSADGAVKAVTGIVEVEDFREWLITQQAAHD